MVGEKHDDGSKHKTWKENAIEKNGPMENEGSERRWHEGSRWKTMSSIKVYWVEGIKQDEEGWKEKPA